jgi:hypothetical protein
MHKNISEAKSQNYRHNMPFKIKVLTTQELSYLHDQIRPHAPTRQLRSNGQGLLQVHRNKSVFAERAFRHPTPAVWNSLPQHLITDLSNFPTFKRHLKTELILVHSSGDP